MSKLLEIALSQYGVTEVKGAAHNPTIVNYSKEIGYAGIVDDETAWCSIFMNWCALKARLERSRKLNARSWLKVGQDVENPSPGDVVVFWRGHITSWKGHVAIYINHSEDGKFIYCLGGNQRDKVCIQAYDVSRVLSFRELCLESEV